MSSTAQTAEGEKILIVDDDPGLSSLLERFFNSKGYR
ncbi:MAG: two-component system response regulator OmpR, partial [Pseudomonas orientalis]|nr:two-component system response regulator OmpR [Pseudomonas orientalis]